jgi:hypothetical protein
MHGGTAKSSTTKDRHDSMNVLNVVVQVLIDLISIALYNVYHEPRFK